MVTEINLEDVGSLREDSILNLNHSRRKAVYYRPIKQNNGEVEWEKTMPLPADPQSIAYYFAKGFKAKPPQGEVGGAITCPICGFEAKSVFGLQAHLKIHRKEDKA